MFNFTLDFAVFKRKKTEEDPLIDMIAKIKSGDKALREKLIHDYKPFILKSVSRITGKFVEIENSEEYSVALMAFHEAITSFNDGKHKSFLSFADLVINRRVIDYIRKNKKASQVLPFTYFQSEDDSSFEERYLSSDAVGELNQIEIKEEILFFKDQLESFGISFKELARSVPKHKDSKKMCIEIAKTIIDHPKLWEKLNQSKNIPMTELMKLTHVYHGTIERNRKFIIALCLILTSGLEVIKSYVQFVEEGGVNRG